MDGPTIFAVVIAVLIIAGWWSRVSIKRRRRVWNRIARQRGWTYELDGAHAHVFGSHENRPVDLSVIDGDAPGLETARISVGLHRPIENETAPTGALEAERRVIVEQLRNHVKSPVELGPRDIVVRGPWQEFGQRASEVDDVIDAVTDAADRLDALPPAPSVNDSRAVSAGE